MKLNELNRKVQGLSYYEMLEMLKLEDEQTVQDCWKFAHKIKQYCKPYLNAVGYRPVTDDALYRGIKFGSSNNENFLRKQVRLNNRTPSDSGTDIHKVINDYFTKELGAPFRNSIFASGNRAEVVGYGQPYIIFPIGEFKYAWSGSVEDLYSNVNVYGIGENKERTGMSQEHWDENVTDFTEEYLTTYRTDLIHEAINSGHEVMIRCKSYYALKERFPELGQIENNRIHAMMQGVLL